jgi:hypothetical protein
MIKTMIVCVTILMVSGVSIAQERTVTGRLLSGKNEPVEFGYLINARTSVGVETHLGGSFKMALMPGDSLFFRCLGYADTTLIVAALPQKQDTLNFYVERHFYALKEVQVNWFKSYASFKQAFLNVKVKTPGSINLGPLITNEEAMALAKAKSGTFGYGFSVGSGLSKAERKFRVFLAEENRHERLRELTSRDNLQVFTGFQGAKLDSFIVFLRSKYAIDPDWSDYQILASVKLAYEQFLSYSISIADSSKVQ